MDIGRISLPFSSLILCERTSLIPVLAEKAYLLQLRFQKPSQHPPSRPTLHPCLWVLGLGVEMQRIPRVSLSTESCSDSCQGIAGHPRACIAKMGQVSAHPVETE